MNRIYLDNAATSWPKAKGVVDAVTAYMADNGAPAGRSGYAEADQSQRMVTDCRRRLAQLIHAKHPSNVAMAFNGTDALNMAIHGLLRPGDHVITTNLEHNSVLRPLQHLADREQISVSYVAPDETGRIQPADIANALQDETRLVIVTHVSNVTGAIQPVKAIGQLTTQHAQALLLIDAAQSLGHLPVDVHELGVDVLAASTHKGIRGPLGTGMLYVGPRAESAIQSWRQGGTGTQSEDPRQPDHMPERLESGNLNMVGIAGLGAALASLAPETLEANRNHEMRLVKRLLDGLAALPAYRVAGGLNQESIHEHTGVVSITADVMSPQDLAMLLDASFRIQARAGLHCAPLTHRGLGTLESGGTLRLSVGPDNSDSEIDVVLQALRELA